MAPELVHPVDEIAACRQGTADARNRCIATGPLGATVAAADGYSGAPANDGGGTRRMDAAS